MKIGVTGHQAREGIDWTWVQRSLRAELAKLPHLAEAYSSLAAGTDQVFAETALSLHIPVVAVIPLNDYEKYFEGENLAKYRQLLGRCKRVSLDWKGDEERAFFEAGKFIVKGCDVLMAVWDGEAAEGLGGTGDVVGFARKSGKGIVHLNPIEQTIERI